MSALTNFAENKLLDHLLGVAEYPMPTSLYVGLFTAAPGEGGGGTEVSGGGYARVRLTASPASSGSASNASTLTFPRATANWGIVTHVGVFDAQTGGNLLVYGALSTSVQVLTNDVVVIPAQSLVFTAD